MWKHVLLSTGIVAAIWLSSSLVTTTYLRWLEGSYEKSLQENLASIDAADSIREDVWRLQANLEAHRHTAPSTPATAEIESRIERSFAQLKSAVATPSERTMVGEMKGLLPRNQQAGRSAIGSPSWAEEISTRADRISKIEHDLLESASRRRMRIGSRIFWGRLIAILVGPVLGIVLGWWFSRRLVQTVAQIRVTLTGTSVGSNDELGTVRFRGKDDLQFIQQQIETVVARLRDTASELQQARADVVRTERLAAIGGLAAGVAHELRNPLTSVKLLLQHAASRPEAVLPPAKLRLILDEIGRIEATIQGLLDFSRPPTLQRVRHDLRNTLRRATILVEGRAASQNVKLLVDLDERPLMVNGDAQQLHQVFANILINGIEAMPQGGLLSMRAEPIEADSRVRVRIEDTGSGIPAEILSRLFEPFATSKERGTGLGLAISRRIVEEHAGKIEAANLPECGAAFEVILPCQVTANGPPDGDPAVATVSVETTEHVSHSS